MAVSVSIRTEISEILERLPESNLKALLEVLRQMDSGQPLRRWSKAIGSLSAAEAEEMRRVIEEGCENIDEESWQVRL